MSDDLAERAERLATEAWHEYAAVKDTPTGLTLRIAELLRDLVADTRRDSLDSIMAQAQAKAVYPAESSTDGQAEVGDLFWLSRGVPMSMSDCSKCWNAPCTCGHDYLSWSRQAILDQIEMLQSVLDGANEEHNRRKLKEVREARRRLPSFTQPRSRP